MSLLVTALCSAHDCSLDIWCVRNKYIKSPALALTNFVALCSFTILAPELFFFFILAHPVHKMWIIQIIKHVRIMKQTAFWRGTNGVYIPCLKYAVPIFVIFFILAHPVHKMWIIQIIKHVRIMKQTAFWRGRNGEYIPCLKYAVPIFVIFLILAHPVYKMWIIQEPNTLELWNKLHFEEEETESIYHV